MKKVRFLNKLELKKVKDQDLEKLWDTSKRFAENVENEIYNRQWELVERIRNEEFIQSKLAQTQIHRVHK